MTSNRVATICNLNNFCVDTPIAMYIQFSVFYNDFTGNSWSGVQFKILSVQHQPAGTADSMNTLLIRLPLESRAL